jgi:hypothetical protein
MLLPTFSSLLSLVRSREQLPPEKKPRAGMRTGNINVTRRQQKVFSEIMFIYVDTGVLREFFFGLGMYVSYVML